MPRTPALAIVRAVPDGALDALLKGVSRSFYLSLAILPRALRVQLSVAYLIARAADTIADTQVVRRDRRLELLERLREVVGTGAFDRAPRLAEDVRVELVGRSAIAAERLLLERLADCLVYLSGFEEGDRDRVAKVLDELLSGMRRDLERFDPDGPLAALETMSDLDRYVYDAAGCVGDFWSLMTAAHVPAAVKMSRPDLRGRAVRLGKGLQLVNVLRDAPEDLAARRCYVPTALLGRFGLAPEALSDPARRRSARPVLDELVRLALEHFDAAFPYVVAIPRSEPRLRLAALWPLWIGLETLRLYAADGDPLDPARRIKISRGDVYRLVGESSTAIASDMLLIRAHEARRARISV